MTEQQLEEFKKLIDLNVDLPTEEQLKNFNHLMISFTEFTSKEDKKLCKEVNDFLKATELFYYLLKPISNAWG